MHANCFSHNIKWCRNALLMCKYLIYFWIAQATSTPLNHRGANVRFNRPLQRRTLLNPSLACTYSSASGVNRSCIRQLLESESDVHLFGTTRLNHPVQHLVPNLRRSTKTKLHSAQLGWKNIFNFSAIISCPLQFLSFCGQALIVLLSIPLWLVALYIVTVEYVFSAHRSGNRILRSESIC